ncbi:hypothetical protein GCM10011352_13870 [Marinobacterium zhoushanense]|uniref:DUF4845 domain-containing protein n=1 Tax=Marinobacterium zhoushanense TaxID=1679163 RepID=A0ABQ1K5S0_9GAMM|nr:DUF4845 domain-containing protein [Marinobacterium zhoushanense]GGB89078.1 hypothetical protein GCM10011352_13870 [Marinobacterium zhoushanense]
MRGYRCGEQGASILATLIVIMVAGVFFTVGFKLYTPYMDHWTIKSIVENVTLDQDELKKPIPEIKRDLDRRFGINQVRLPERESLKIKLEEGVLHFDLDYETRVPMFYNVDAVVVFKEHFEVTKP